MTCENRQLCCAINIKDGILKPPTGIYWVRSFKNCFYLPTCPASLNNPGRCYSSFEMIGGSVRRQKKTRMGRSVNSGHNQHLTQHSLIIIKIIVIVHGTGCAFTRLKELKIPLFTPHKPITALMKSVQSKNSPLQCHLFLSCLFQSCKAFRCGWSWVSLWWRRWHPLLLYTKQIHHPQ